MFVFIYLSLYGVLLIFISLSICLSELQDNLTTLHEGALQTEGVLPPEFHRKLFVDSAALREVLDGIVRCLPLQLSTVQEQEALSRCRVQAREVIRLRDGLYENISNALKDVKASSPSSADALPPGPALAAVSKRGMAQPRSKHKKKHRAPLP